ncbi:hypothetical protein Pcinc_019794 [Petrolisthes cinctipes]|uniref:Uncharacterized protein n=1 Tax=Petrolisthes cinctipes TaxID=88211 RepID=A0AAE1KKP5_PETCI|nr:hypothetical protein Pcinc_019794 [Petrolisthes cinctipes]
MPGDVSHHRLITRPPGLPGYQPGRWCAVCGKTTSDKSIIDCSSGDCPNTSHTTCLGDSNTFDCCEVLALRTALGITAPVVYQAATADSQDSSDLLDTDTSDVAAADDDDDLEDLLKLDPRELVENIRQLRKELKRKKNILSFYEATSQTLAEKRDAECRTRIAQEREENLFRRISTEQAQNNALLVQTLNRFLPPAPPDPGPAIPQPLIGNWAPRHQAHTPHALYPAYTHSYTLQPPNLVNTAWSHAHP